MKARLRTRSGFLLFLALFISFRLMVPFSAGGLLANYTDRFFHMFTAHLSHHGHHPIVNLYLTAR